MVTPGEGDTVNSLQLQGKCITPDRVNGGTTEVGYSTCWSLGQICALHLVHSCQCC